MKIHFHITAPIDFVFSPAYQVSGVSNTLIEELRI